MKIIIREQQLDMFLRRRFSSEDLNTLVRVVQELINTYDDTESLVYDGVREFIKMKNFPDIDEHGDDNNYWRTYLRYEDPLVNYVKSKLDIE